MRGTFLCVKKNNNNQELCPLISVTRKGRESNFGPSQDLWEWYISSLQPQKKKKNVKQRRVRDHHIFESGLLCDFCDAFKGKKCKWLYLAPFLELLSLFNCGEIVHCCIFDDRQEDKKEADPQIHIHSLYVRHLRHWGTYSCDDGWHCQHRSYACQRRRGGYHNTGQLVLFISSLIAWTAQLCEGGWLRLPLTSQHRIWEVE